jgi:hypothetical protein
MDPRTRSRIRSLSRQGLTEEAKLLASCQETHQLRNVKRQRVQSIGRRIPSSSGRASRLEPTSPRHATKLGSGGRHGSISELCERGGSQSTDTGGQEWRCPPERLAGISERGHQDPDVRRQRVEDSVPRQQAVE